MYLHTLNSLLSIMAKTRCKLDYGYCSGMDWLQNCMYFGKQWYVSLCVVGTGASSQPYTYLMKKYLLLPPINLCSRCHILSDNIWSWRSEIARVMTGIQPCFHPCFWWKRSTSTSFASTSFLRRRLLYRLTDCSDRGDVGQVTPSEYASRSAFDLLQPAFWPNTTCWFAKN